MAMRRHHAGWDIDFAGPSLQRSLWRMRVIALVAGLAGLSTVGWAVTDFIDLLQRNATLDAELAAVGQRLAARARVHPAVSRLALSQPETDDINGKIARLNLPWNELFQALESATPASVSLVELTPDARKNIVTGVAEAAGSDDMLGYVARLGSQPFFSSVLLNRHETNLTDPNKPLRFHFTAVWARETK